MIQKYINERLSILLVSIAFWVWLAKDFVLSILPNIPEKGRLMIVLIIVIMMIFLSRRLYLKINIPFSAKITSSFRRSICFFALCSVSGIVSGYTAFTYFKITSLLLGIIIGYLLSDDVVRVIYEDMIVFVKVGITIGVLGFLVNYKELSTLSYLGLRTQKIAHLNIQDYYVFLFLSSLVLLIINKANVIAVMLFMISTVLSFPVIIAINSRMIPFTMGIALLYIIYWMIRSKKYKTLIKLVGVMAIIISVMYYRFVDDFKDIRMFQPLQSGYLTEYDDDPRSDSYEKAFRNFTSSPLYGYGFAKFILYDESVDYDNMISGQWAHNIFLEVASEMGIIGLIMLIRIILPVISFVVNPEYFREAEWGVLSVLYMVYVFVNMQLTQNIFYPLFWLSVFMVDSAGRKVKQKFINNTRVI